MLSLESLRYHCRTCLIKLEESNGDAESQKCAIKTFPNVEHLMRLCLRNGTTADCGEIELDGCAPNMCRVCLDRWQDFARHCQLAIQNDHKLKQFMRKFLKPEPGESDNMDNSNKFAIFIPTETAHSICEIEKYETTSPFYHDSLSNTSNTSDLPLCEERNNCMQEQQQNENVIVEISSKLNSPNSANSEYFQHVDSDDAQTINSKKIFNKSKIKQKRPTYTVCKIKRKYKTRNSLNDSAKVNSKTTSHDFDEGGNKKLRYHCEPCNKYFFELHKYEGHVKQIHEGIQRPYQCQDCDKSYNSYKNLSHHIAEKHSQKSQEIHRCEECQKLYKTNVTLRQHMINQHSNCKDSNQKEQSSCTTTTKNSNREHTRTICDQCGFMAAHQNSLVQHIINKHTEAKEIKCEHCPKIFKSQYNLKYHMLSSHNPTNTKPFQCTECQMTFTRRTLLNLHKRTHLQYTERIKCDFEGCAVRFVKPGDKRHHMRLVHLKVKQHVCDFCGEAFGAMQTLRHHRYIHTGERPYKCNVCGQGFRQHTAMKTHRKAHFGKEDRVQPQDVISNLSEIDMQLV